MADKHDKADADPNAAVALAALSVCESLIVALIEKGLLDLGDVEYALEGAIESHRHAEPDTFTQHDHDRAAKVIEFLMTRANGIRAIGHL